jgi:DNA-binding SARP family transcriptional activator
LLRLSLIGKMQAQDAAGQNVLPRSRKTRAVLAVLAVAAPKPVLRTRLTGLLWSRRAREQAKGSLRQSLHELKSALGPHALSVLQTGRDHLALLEATLWLDVRMLLAATGDHAGFEMLQATLLEDLDGLDPAFDCWLAEQRQQVRQQAIVVAELALAAEAEPTGRLAAAERVLTMDSTHEGAWQALIRAYLDGSDHTGARIAFDRYAKALTRAGLAPSREAGELIQGVAHGVRHPPRHAGLHASDKAVRLAVMPPRALGRDDGDDLLPGLTEDITAAISRFRWIACFSGSPRVAQEPDGPDRGYVLDTTIQRSGEWVRVIIRLLDLHAGSNVIWAGRFDRQLDDVLSIQAEIAGTTAAQIDPELLLYDGERRLGMEPRMDTPFDLTLRAIPSLYRLEPAGFRASGELLAQAVSADPASAAAHAWWAYWHLFLVGQGWSNDPVAATLRAGELAERAVTLDAGDARALALVGHVRGFLHKRAGSDRTARAGTIA